MSTKLVTKDPKKLNQLMSIIIGIINNALFNKQGCEEEDFLKIVQRAKQEMIDSQIYFDNVTDPQLVDHAIYRMEAAKSHYVYLIKQAKAKGISVRIQQ